MDLKDATTHKMETKKFLASYVHSLDYYNPWRMSIALNESVDFKDATTHKMGAKKLLESYVQSMLNGEPR